MKYLFPLILLLAGCGREQGVVVRTEAVEVKVPVSTPCRAGDRPEEPVALRDRFTLQEWQSLSTDQRENLVAAQALDRKAYGDKLTAHTAGC